MWAAMFPLCVCVHIVLTNACSDGVVNIVAMLSLFNRSP